MTRAAAPSPVVPPLPSHPFLGHTLAFATRPLEFLRAAARAGDLVEIRRRTALRRPPQPSVLVSHPDHINQVFGDGMLWARGPEVDRLSVMIGSGLVSSSGAFHQRQRRLVLPAFSHQRLPGYTRTVQQALTERLAGWHDGMQVDMNEELRAIAMRAVAQALFATALGKERVREISGTFQFIQARFARRVLALPDELVDAPLPGNLRYRRAALRLRGIIGEIVRDYRAEGRDRGDLLSMLLLARDDDTNEQMTDTQVIDEAITLLLAGYETTAGLLAWTLYLLSQHPEAQARLREEIETADGGPADPVAVQGLPYLRQVLHESLRVWPPVWLLGRRATADTHLGEVPIPADTTVLVSPYVVHHDQRWYPDPDRFDPDRWAKDRAEAIPRRAFLPFGSGAHHCVGERLAWAEASLVLATILAGWRCEFAPGTRVRPLIAGSVNPRQLPMILHARQASA